MFMKIVLLIVLVASLSESQDQGDVCNKYTNLCIKDYCETCFAGKCSPSDPPPTDDYVALKMYETVEDYCDCCSQVFVQIIEEGKDCSHVIDGYNLQDQGICGPGLSCRLSGSSKEEYKCQRIETECHKEQDRYDEKLDTGTLGMNEDRPICDREGYYEPLQCFFSGVCRCVDKMTGVPIFGFSLNLEVANANDVHCGCATYASQIKNMSCPMELEFKGNSKEYDENLKECEERDTYYFQDSLRCLPSGDYDRAQCISRFLKGETGDGLPEEICFCIDKDTANITSSAFFIDEAASLLDCYSQSEEHALGFYRPCEIERRLKSERPSNYSGYVSNMWMPVCGPDGYYALKQHDESDKNQGYCSDQNNNPIENYTGVYSEMDCLCAQVRNAMRPTDDRPECDKKGSFKSKQCRGERCYCVNQYGKQVGQEGFQVSDEECDQTYHENFTR